MQMILLQLWQQAFEQAVATAAAAAAQHAGGQ